jgi:hypothetical protein
VKRWDPNRQRTVPDLRQPMLRRRARVGRGAGRPAGSRLTTDRRIRERQLTIDDPDRVLLIGRHELRRHVPEDVVNQALRHGNVPIPGEPGGFEAKMAELVDQVLQRHAVLERQGDRGGEAVHQATDRRALLRHAQEDLAGGAVLVEADGQVALVAADVELVGDRGALVRQPPAELHVRALLVS